MRDEILAILAKFSEQYEAENKAMKLEIQNCMPSLNSSMQQRKPTHYHLFSPKRAPASQAQSCPRVLV